MPRERSGRKFTSTTFSSVPLSALTRVKQIADAMGMTDQAITEQITNDLIKAVNTKRNITWEARRGLDESRTFGTRLPEEVIERINEICKSVGISRTTFFLTAISRFLQKNGQPYP